MLARHQHYLLLVEREGELAAAAVRRAERGVVEAVHVVLRVVAHLGVGQSKLQIKLAPETQAALAEPLKVIDPTGEMLEVATDPDFKNGEARVTWENGFLKYNLDRVVSELLDGLREASSKMNPQPQKV